jgi:hypothetical protein
MHETHGRLVAIMFVQVTEQTDDDKELPVASSRLTENQKDLRVHFNRFRGEILEIRPGEIYAYFSGAVSAFHAALMLQRMMPQFSIRIGLHLGEVLHRKGKFQGRDVNLASRLPEFARAGGICLSQSVYQYLEDQDKQILVALGKHDLKNVAVGVPLFAYLPVGQKCRCKLRELKSLLTKKIRKCRRFFWLLPLVGVATVIAMPLYIDNSVPVRKVVKLYLARFELQTQDDLQNELLESIEVAVRSVLSGGHEFYDLHLLNKRSSAPIELLVTIKQVSGKIQAGYTINGLPEGETLAYGGFEEDESRAFYIQDRLSDQILSALRQYLIQHPTLASDSVRTKLGIIGVER